MNKTRIVKESINSLTFKSETNGTVTVKLGNMIISQGYVSVEDARNAAERWINKNIGLQVEY